MDNQELNDLAKKFIDLHIELTRTANELSPFYASEDHDILSGEKKEKFDLLTAENEKAMGEIKAVWTKAKDIGQMADFYAKVMTIADMEYKNQELASVAKKYANIVLEPGYKPKELSKPAEPVPEVKKGFKRFFGF